MSMRWLHLVMCLHVRRHYIKKCEQFFKLKSEQDAEQVSSMLGGCETTPKLYRIMKKSMYLNRDAKKLYHENETRGLPYNVP